MLESYKKEELRSGKINYLGEREKEKKWILIPKL